MKTIVKIYKNGVLQQGITPIFGKDIVLNRAKEGEEMFLRESIEGTWSFLGNGYTLLHDANTHDKFEIDVAVENAGSVTTVGRGYFYKYDCEFDQFKKIAKVKATYSDNYTEILAKYSNEYDLVQLAPPSTSVDITKRAVLQFYTPGDNKLTNIIGGSSYEVDCEQVASGDLWEYHFSEVVRKSALRIQYSDIYGEPFRTEQQKAFLRAISGFMLSDLPAGSSHPNTFTVRNYVFTATYTSGKLYYFITNPNTEGTLGYLTGPNAEAVEQGRPVWVYMGASHSTHIATTDSDAFSNIIIHGRVIFDRENTPGAQDIPENDITTANLNYRYCRPYPTSNINKNYIKLNTSVSDNPTKWGKTASGKYYDEPEHLSFRFMYPAIPIGISFWGSVSTWFFASPYNIAMRYEGETNRVLSDFDSVFTLKDAYLLSDAISKLLSQIDPTITFSPTENYSQFLYSSTNPVSSESNYDILIAPISNIKKSYYSTPAQKGKITLKAILDMLRSCYQLYWFIDEVGEDKHASFKSTDFDDSYEKTKRLRIEHISYFKNGYAYTGTPNEIADITASAQGPMLAPRNMREWGYGLSHYSYDKDKLPSRYEFGWNTGVTEVFNGYPIKTTDVEIQGNQKKEMTASLDADIDLILSNPSLFSDDGWAVMEKDNDGGVPIVGISGVVSNVPACTRNAQNGRMAYLYTEQRFYKNSLGGMTNEIEGFTQNQGTDMGKNVPFPTPQDRSEALIQAMKQDNVVFPLNVSKIHENGVIVTDLGSGLLDSLKWNIETGIATAEILFTPN